MEASISLRKAVTDGNLVRVQSLLKQNPLLIHIDNNNEYSRKGRSRRMTPTVPGPTCLHLACQKGNLPIVKLLVERGASLEVTSVDNDEPIWAATTRYTPLHCASMYGFAEIVSFLVERGAKMEAPTINKHSPPDTALVLACQKNHLEVVRVLLKAGAVVKSHLLHLVCRNGFLDLAKFLAQEASSLRDEITEDTDGLILHEACTSGNGLLVEWLLDQGALLEAGLTDGWTPLMQSLNVGSSEAARVLINRGANVQVTNSDGCTPFYLACLSNHDTPEIAKMLLDRGADLEKGENSDTPLIAACGESHTKVVKFLIDQGANIEARDGHGQTPLHAAAKQEKEEIVAFLLDHGAKTNVTDIKGNLPVHYACEQQNLEMARLFFQHETPTASTDDLQVLHVACRFGCMMPTLVALRQDSCQINATACDGKTALHFAVEFGHLPIVQVLLNQGADSKIPDNNGWMPLHWACGKGHTEIAEMLLKQGSNIEAKERHGWTPLQLASQNTKLETVQFLLDLGANIHACALNGWTSLHIVCKFGGSKVARLLLDKGADLNARTAKDWTPLHVACRYGHLKIVHLLLDRGADWKVRAKGRVTPEKLARKFNHTAVTSLFSAD